MKYGRDNGLPEGRIGYTIDADSGVVKKDDGKSFATMEFGWACEGDYIDMPDSSGYEFCVATYGLQHPDKYIYTYDYEQEENWSTYNHDFKNDKFISGRYVFKADCYFRFAVRRKDGSLLCEEDIDKAEAILKALITEKEFTPKECFVKEIAATASKIKEIKGKKFVILSDSHFVVNGTWDDTVDNIRKVISKAPVDGIIHLGDFTDGMVSRDINSKYIRKMLSDFKSLSDNLYLVYGNHDTNYFRNNPDKFSPDEMTEIYGTEPYYYRDLPDLRIRMFFLDSFDYRQKDRYGFSDEEAEWFRQELSNIWQNYRILIFSHVPPLPEIHYWSDVIRNGSKMVEAVENFQRVRGNEAAIAWIHGHNHADQIYRKRRFPIISLGCNKCEYFTDKKPEGSVTFKRKMGEQTQDLWDVLTITEDNLEFTRFGAGEDRTVPIRGEARMKKVITYGTFDLFHEGHYNLLKRAKELGDYLIVGVTTEHFDEARGKVNVVDSIIERIENVKKTGLADMIIVEDHEKQKVEDIQKYGVDIFTVGSDWTGHFDYLRDYCEVVYLPRTPNISSTYLRTNRFPIVRIGIIGTGRLAPRFMAEAKYVSGTNVNCAFNPITKDLEQFAAAHEIQCFSEDFDEFLEKVDAVYIASPSETHYDYAKRSMEKGKHVLCEKPLSFTKKEAIDLYSYANEKNLVLLEGVKAAYCPGFQQLLSVAKSGKIGEIRDVEACFSRLTDPTLREVADAKYGGAFLEFGGYPLLPIIKLLGKNYKSIHINSIYGENGVDLYTKLQLEYDNGMATAKTGVGVKSEGQLVVAGTKGYILAESPWWLTKKFEVRYEDASKIETYQPIFKGDGLRYEINEFVTKINGINKQEYNLTADESIAMAEIVEQFMNKRKKEQSAK